MAHVSSPAHFSPEALAGWKDSENITPPIDISEFSAAALLALHAQVAEEIRARGITRSSNNPTGDLAEYLFCKVFGWTQSANSKANIDAVAADGTRCQI
jgi:hypothetical protein